MKNTTTWLDRLRSRLTGQPVKYYATRRLAREDLHALDRGATSPRCPTLDYSTLRSGVDLRTGKISILEQM